jgi:hypothetical protein
MSLAREQARQRRVVLFNLLGDGVTLARLVADDDPHGASDGVRYGLSLRRISRALADVPHLLIVPGGVESPLVEDVLGNPRWTAWAEECRQSEALMIVAAPSTEPHIARLLDQLDGVIVVGSGAAPASRARMLGRVGPARRAPHRAGPLSKKRPSRRRAPRLVLLGAGALVIAAGVWWGRSALLGRTRTSGGDSLAAQGLSTGSPVLAPPPGLTDTMELAPWSVELASVNSAAGALLRVREAVDSVPVPTYSPTLLGATSAPWYRLVAGAYVRMESADSLLAALRDRGVVEAGAGRVIRTPYAWLVEDSVPPELMPGRLFAWRQQGLPAYALFGPAGSVRIYVGAFESEAEARLFAPALDSLNIHATLSARVGSMR